MLYIGLGILALVIIFFIKKKTASTEVHAQFGLRESTHKILSTDLGEKTARVRLSRMGINGIADAVFKAISGKEIVVGEFKSRKHRGVVKLYEFYQITLYMGHLQMDYPEHTIKGCLAYADAKVQIVFDQQLYEALLGLRSEYWESAKSKRAVNRTPLHKRVKVNSLNGGIKFSAGL